MQNSNQFRDWPEGVTPPKGLKIKFTTMENPFMQKAFLHAMKHNELQKESGIRAIASVLVLQNGKIIYGVAGELENEDDVTFHAKEGYCVRYKNGSGTANSDYDSCPGCVHTNHSERVALRKAIRDYGEEAVKGAEIYLYGHWWACQPCMNAVAEKGIKTIYLLENARKISDRAQPNHEQARKDFEQKWLSSLEE